MTYGTLPSRFLNAIDSLPNPRAQMFRRDKLWFPISSAEFLRRGLFTKHVAKMRKVYSSRLSALDEALRKHMPEETRWTRPEGGMCLWLELPPGFDASELLIHAKERGVLFAPGRYFYVQNPLPNTLRLGYAGLDEKQIARGVATLADVCRREFGVPERIANVEQRDGARPG